MTAEAILEEEIDLTRHYTAEERDSIYEAGMAALMRGDDEEADRINAYMPLTPHWAKIIAEVMGKEYLQENFNITHANEVYGEGWLDEIKEYPKIPSPNDWPVPDRRRRAGGSV